MRKIFCLIFQLICIASYAQSGTASLKIAWLSGEWEGTGYMRMNSERQDFKFNFNIESFVLRLESSNGQMLLKEKLDLNSEYTHVETGGDLITVYFLGEMKWDNIELKIFRVDENSFNLSVLYNRRSMKDKLIANGAFSRVAPKK